MLVESNSGTRCQGLYRGQVVQHLTHGRLKVFVYGIYPEAYINQPDLLPICEQMTPLWGGSYDGNGSFSYPNLSSTIWIQFANEDVNYPVAIGATLGGENAYWQYENIKAKDEEISKKHMFTTGMAHFEMHESGKISSYVQQPYDNNVSIDFSKGDVSCEVSAEIAIQIDNNEISHIVCQHVIDNDLNNGEISASTHHFINKTHYINTKIQQNNTDNITLDTVCFDSSTSSDASVYVNINSTENVGIHDIIIDNKEKCRIIDDRTATNGKIEILITDLDTGYFSRLYLEKTGNVFLESTQSITLKSNSIKLEAANIRMDSNSNIINFKDDMSITSIDTAPLVINSDVNVAKKINAIDEITSGNIGLQSHAHTAGSCGRTSSSIV